MSGDPDRASRAERERALLAQMAATIIAGSIASPNAPDLDDATAARHGVSLARAILAEIDKESAR